MRACSSAARPGSCAFHPSSVGSPSTADFPPGINLRRSVTVLEQVRALSIFARANTVLPERPDRIPRALLAMLPYRGSALGALAASAARYPGRPAFVGPEGSVTYRDLWRSSTALAHGLRDDYGI